MGVQMADSMEDTIRKAFENSVYKREQPYDGVLGRLPDEWPVNFHNQFELTRDKLLRNGYSKEELQTFINEMIEIHERALNDTENYRAFNPITPFQIWGDVEVLAKFLIAYRLGVDEGLAFVTDKKHATNYFKGKQFTAGKRKGALKSTTKYLKELRMAYPEEKAEYIYSVAIQQAEDGKSPFKYDHADGGILLDGDKEIDIIKFGKRLSKAKNR